MITITIITYYSASSINVVLCHQFHVIGQEKLLKPKPSPTVQCLLCAYDIPKCSVPCVSTYMISHSAVSLVSSWHPTVQSAYIPKCSVSCPVSTLHPTVQCPMCPADIPQCSVQCRADLAAGGYIDSIRGVFLEHCLQQPQPWQRRQPGEDCWLYNCPPGLAMSHLHTWQDGRACVYTSAANRLIGEVVQSWRRPLLGLLLVESAY